MPNDIKLTIATAPQRYTKIWRHTETTWLHLAAKLETTARTGETVAEYKAMSKTAKDSRKDVGGYVCGRLKDGRRLKGNVEYRQVVTLDADSAGRDIATDIDLALGQVSYCYYSTHSHTPDKPRLRILIPLSAPVPPDQYQAIARMLAKDIDIEAMDPTTYEPERLMYWPSTPQDGQYLYQTNDAPILDPETVLARYDHWQDVSVWPSSKREAQVTHTSAARQGDPLAKPGLIGAFCRAHSIQDAISRFLPEVYSGDGDRYTYTGGSTTGGLVVYDDKFAYSHHSTDPSSGHLCNAFDLVRLHLYGHLDEDAAEGTPSARLPSFLAMAKMAGKDKETVKQLNDETMAEVKQLFRDEDLPPEDQSLDWMGDLSRGSGKNTAIEPTADNIIRILTHDPLIKGRMGLDLFSHRIVLKDDLPWRKRGDDVIWRDADDASLRNYLSRYYKITGRQVIDDALTEVINSNAFHPVREYLDSLTWDGSPRACSLYIDTLQAEDSKYTREVTMLHLKAAIARVMHPGAKFDACLVLVGPQGIGKSTTLKRLGRSWFNDSLVSLQGKEAMEQLQGSWIIELQEMQAVNKSENDLIKAFISRQVDRFRAPYGRRTEEFPRQCIFAATTNDSIFLKDRTGGRRFWPMICHGRGRMGPDELTEEYIDQVWAEVYARWRGNPSLELPEDVARVAKDLQEAHTEGAEKEGLIRDYLDRLLPEDWDAMEPYERSSWLSEAEHLDDEGVRPRDKVCALEIWCEAFGGKKNNFTNANMREINTIMQFMPGWVPYEKNGRRTKIRFGGSYGVQRAYIRKGGK